MFHQSRAACGGNGKSRCLINAFIFLWVQQSKESWFVIDLFLNAYSAFQAFVMWIDSVIKYQDFEIIIKMHDLVC